LAELKLSKKSPFLAEVTTLDNIDNAVIKAIAKSPFILISYISWSV
jgi:hypothetical protein